MRLPFFSIAGIGILALLAGAWPSFPTASEVRSQTHDTRQDSGQSVVMRFAGDCLLAAYYEEAVGADVDRAFKGFDLLHSADIAVVNLECPITTRGIRVAKPFNFRMNPQFLGAISQAGIDVVNIANNHIFDYGSVGLFDTITYLDSASIKHVGAGRNREEAHRPVIQDIRGKTIGILGYYGGGEAPEATPRHPGVARRELEGIVADVSRLRTQDSVTYVVVCLHWGTEKAERPDMEQRAFAHALVDAGADAVIGHHPHVLQGIERYKTGIIVYSLGNFIFGGNSRDTYDTGVFEISLGQEGPAFRFIPIRVVDWHASLLTGTEGTKLMEKVRRLSSVFPRSIFTN